MNMNALITSLCQEKAVLHETTLDEVWTMFSQYYQCSNLIINIVLCQVEVRCKVLPSNNISEFTMQHEAAIYLKSVYAFNAKWDSEKGKNIFSNVFFTLYYQLKIMRNGKLKFLKVLKVLPIQF